ncbi:hypothetical protein EZS27_040446, partial [termite gut metagenome]
KSKTFAKGRTEVDKYVNAEGTIVF